MSYKLKLLFIDRLNKVRANNACLIINLRHWGQYETRARGTNWQAEPGLSAEDVKWADIIFPMDTEQEQFVLRNFPEQTANKPVYLLQVPYREYYTVSKLREQIHEAVMVHVSLFEKKHT